MIFLNTTEDIAWLYTTALREVSDKPAVETVHAAILEGNADAPHYIALYAETRPFDLQDFGYRGRSRMTPKIPTEHSTTKIPAAEHSVVAHIMHTSKPLAEYSIMDAEEGWTYVRGTA